jgi:hypothetical protein
MAEGWRLPGCGSLRQGGGRWKVVRLRYDQAGGTAEPNVRYRRLNRSSGNVDWRDLSFCRQAASR